MGGVVEEFIDAPEKASPSVQLRVSPRGHVSLPEDLIEILSSNGLHYGPGSETGTLFHLIGAVSEFGKLGLTAIGNSREEVETIYGRALSVLDRETGCGR